MAPANQTALCFKADWYVLVCLFGSCQIALQEKNCSPVPNKGKFGDELQRLAPGHTIGQVPCPMNKRHSRAYQAVTPFVCLSSLLLTHSLPESWPLGSVTTHNIIKIYSKSVNDTHVGWPPGPSSENVSLARQTDGDLQRCQNSINPLPPHLGGHLTSPTLHCSMGTQATWRVLGYGGLYAENANEPRLRKCLAEIFLKRTKSNWWKVGLNSRKVT